MRSVNVRSVVLVALAFSLSVWGIVLVGFVALYLLGLVSGGLGGVEGFIASLGFTGFKLSILPFVAAFVGMSCVASVVTAVLAGVGAFLYNSLTPLVGGIEISETPKQASLSQVLRPREAQPSAVPSPPPGPSYPSP